MHEIERVAILGAGAMGSFFASKFHDAPGFSTSLVAQGARYERLVSHGLIVNGKVYRIPVVRPQQVQPATDLVIVAVKHHHLAEALPDLSSLVGDRTTILSVMNGLDSEETIGAMYGMDKVLYGTSVGIDAVREGNRVIYTAPGKHYFGEATNLPITPKVRRVQAAFDRAGIIYETPPDMMRVMWWKFMVNVGMNQASAVMRAQYGAFRESRAAQAVMEALMREVVAIAGVLGVNLVEQDIQDWYEVLPTMSPEGKTSMLQDIEAGRKTEVEMFAGKVIALGRAHGIPTPANQMILHIIHVLEQQRV